MLHFFALLVTYKLIREEEDAIVAALACLLLHLSSPFGGWGVLLYFLVVSAIALLPDFFRKRHVRCFLSLFCCFSWRSNLDRASPGSVHTLQWFDLGGSPPAVGTVLR